VTNLNHVGLAYLELVPYFCALCKHWSNRLSCATT
jgi:hypothetical protein